MDYETRITYRLVVVMPLYNLEFNLNALKCFSIWERSDASFNRCDSVTIHSWKTTKCPWSTYSNWLRQRNECTSGSFLVTIGLQSIIRIISDQIESQWYEIIIILIKRKPIYVRKLRKRDICFRFSTEVRWYCTKTYCGFSTIYN